MPADLTQRLNLDIEYPAWRALGLEVLAAARKEGVDFWVTCGWRSYRAQAAEWSKGRDHKRWPDIIYPVTNALPGQSGHQFSIAWDLCPDLLPEVPKLQPDYRPERFAVLRDICEFWGVGWGGNWKKHRDRPHIYLPGFDTAADLLPLNNAWRTAHQHPDPNLHEDVRRAAVFRLLDERYLSNPAWQDAFPVAAGHLDRLGFLPGASATA